MNNITLKIIGYVETDVREQKDESWGRAESRVVLQREYRQGLQGIEQFSHVLIVTYLHEAQFDPARHLVRRPRGLEDMPAVGIFSQRSKDRPNPIGITAVSIIRIERDGLVVCGLDAIDGTPVIDVKPYYLAYDCVTAAIVPEWVNRLMKDYF